MQRELIKLVSGLFVLTVASCSKDKPAEVTTTGAQPTGSTQHAGSVDSAKPADSAKPSAIPAAGQPAVVFKEGLVTPESVLYDADADEYLVSNINGDPFAADGNGFISRLSPDGKVVKAKWVDKLNSPKGLTIARGNVYVSDIDRVKIFDQKTGAPKGEVVLPKATFANDMATLSDGRVVVSETAVRAGKQAFEPTGNDTVYAIEKDDKTLTTIAKSKELGGPNGILVTKDKTWVVGFGSGELYSLDFAKKDQKDGARADVQKLPKGALDGIVALPNGDVLVSSWDANGVYRGKPGGAFSLAIEGVKAPADIGFDTKRNRVLVPLFHDNEVRAYDVK
jgi:sugar lactone lactonase YvrE